MYLGHNLICFIIFFLSFFLSFFPSLLLFLLFQVSLFVCLFLSSSKFLRFFLSFKFVELFAFVFFVSFCCLSNFPSLFSSLFFNFLQVSFSVSFLLLVSLSRSSFFSLFLSYRMFYHVLSRPPDKCLMHSIESSNVTIQKKMGDMPYCNCYNVAL